MPRVDETWHRLREWTAGSTSAERLAGLILQAEGYTDFDPSHPLGGRDGKKDGTARKDGRVFVLAVYFPRGKQSFNTIKTKFKSDMAGVALYGASGFAFVTNQELTLSQRATLAKMAKVPVDLFHLDRTMAVIDRPDMRTVRDQYLGSYGGVAATAEELTAVATRLEGLQTGGDTFCYWMLYYFDLEKGIAHDFVVIRKGEYPLYDLRLRIVDMDSPLGSVLEATWGEISAPAEFRHVNWPLKTDCYYRVFFHARNGQWHQDLQLKRSEQAECWLAATRVIGRNGQDQLLLHIDTQFTEHFGEPSWRG